MGLQNMRIPKRVGHLVPVYVTLIYSVAMFMHQCLNSTFIYTIHLDKYSPQEGNSYYASFITFTAFCTIGLFNVVTGATEVAAIFGATKVSKGVKWWIFDILDPKSVFFLYMWEIVRNDILRELLKFMNEYDMMWYDMMIYDVMLEVTCYACWVSTTSGFGRQQTSQNWQFARNFRAQ